MDDFGVFVSAECTMDGFLPCVCEVPDIVDGAGEAPFASSRIGREGGLGFLLGSGSGGWRSCVATRRLCRTFIVCVSI